VETLTYSAARFALAMGLFLDVCFEGDMVHGHTNFN
jgi:hypothetical protein